MYKSYIKRVLDLIFALYLILPIILVVAVCALFVWLEDWGPVFYVEKRVGRYGRVFKTYEFRTTKLAAGDSRSSDKPDNGFNDDPGLTNIGKFILRSGIDDLPHLFNILSGDMSFIGPEPELWDNMRSYTLDELRKLQARPGIIGYNQVFCRDVTESEQRLQNDIYYSGNISFLLDCKIISRNIELNLSANRIRRKLQQ